MSEKSEERPQSRFPVEFDSCPRCGCTETLTQQAWAEEAEKGRVNKDTPVYFQQFLVPLIDPMKPPLVTASAIYGAFDICAECGTYYCRKAEVQTAPITMRMPDGSGGMPGISPQ